MDIQSQPTATPAPSGNNFTERNSWKFLTGVLTILSLVLLTAFVYSMSQQYRLLNRVVYLQNQLEFIINNMTDDLNEVQLSAIEQLGANNPATTVDDGSVPVFAVDSFSDLVAGETYNFIQGTASLAGSYTYCGFFDGNQVVVQPNATCEEAAPEETLYATGLVIAKLVPGTDEAVLDELGEALEVMTIKPKDDLVLGSDSIGVPEYRIDTNGGPYDAYQIAQIYYASEQFEYVYPEFATITDLP